MIHTHAVDDTGWTRRGLIVGGSALLTAILLRSDLTPVTDGLRSLAGAKGPQLAVGHVTGSVAGTSLEQMLAAGRVTVRPASRVAAGSTVAGAAAVSVLGFTPGTSIETSPFQSVAVDTLIASPARGEAGSTIPFYAFTSRATPAPMTSAPSRFRVGPGRGLRVGFGMTTASVAGVATATTVFTSGRDAGLPKLREGIYLLGLRPDMWATDTQLPAADSPDWADLASVVVSVGPSSEE